MNKILFIFVVLFSWIANVDSKGQDLYPQKGKNDKWGYIDTTGNVIIPFKYEYGNILFTGGLAPVNLNGKYGYIDKTGAEVVPIEYMSWQEAYKQYLLKRLFSNYAKNYADSKLAENNFIADAYRILNINFSLSQYDANSQTFMVTDDFFGKNIPLPVPASKAKNFSDSWEQIEFSIQYGIENDRIAIKDINFKLPNGETYNTNMNRDKSAADNIVFR